MKVKAIDRTQHTGTRTPAMMDWLRWLSAASRTTPRSTQTRIVEELEAELTLLREENARLKVKRQRVRDRPVGERVRELLPPQRQDEDALDLLARCLLLRDDLIDACREIEHGMRDTRIRLEAVSPTTEPAGSEAARGSLESAA
ncbi:MAG: hypothetical protein WBC33_10530 [Conexibacter sp.]